LAVTTIGRLIARARGILRGGHAGQKSPAATIEAARSGPNENDVVACRPQIDFFMQTHRLARRPVCAQSRCGRDAMPIFLPCGFAVKPAFLQGLSRMGPGPRALRNGRQGELMKRVHSCQEWRLTVLKKTSSAAIMLF
jgi:hypothetical protein